MDIALNLEHDIFVENQDLSLTNETNEVAQDLKIRLQFILNEWFLDTSAGVPYPQIVFERKTNINTIYSIFRKEIKNTDRVKEIKNLIITPDYSKRNILVDFKVKTDDGTINQIINLGI